MGKLLIVLFSPPTQLENTDTVCDLAKAAMEEGHEVTVFFDAEATYNLMKNQATASSKIGELIKQGMKALVCRESARVRGIDVKRGLLEGVVESSLGKLAELLETHNRVVSFG